MAVSTWQPETPPQMTEERRKIRDANRRQAYKQGIRGSALCAEERMEVTLLRIRHSSFSFMRPHSSVPASLTTC